MKVFRSLTLNNVVLYKNVTLDLDYEGITYIGGKNLNATKMTRNNGSGKSLIFKAFADAMLATNPIIVTNTGRAKKDLYDKDTSIEVEFDNRKISKFMKGSSIRYVLSENNKNIESRTNPIAEKTIHEWFPYTQDQFFSLVYLDSGRQFPLHLGTTIQRQNFISDLFSLDDFDTLRKHFKDRVSETKDSLIEFQVHAESLDDINDWLKNKTDVSNKIVKTSKSINKIQKSINKIHIDLAKHKDSISIAKSLDRYNYLSSKLNSTIKDSNLAVLYLEKYNDYRTEAIKYTRQKEQLSKKIRKNQENLNEKYLVRTSKEGRHLLSRFLKKLGHYKQLSKDYDKYLSELVNYTKQRNKYTENLVKAKLLKTKFKKGSNTISSILAVTTSKLIRDQKIYKNLTGDSTCPSCLQPVDIKKLSRVKTELQNKIELNTKKIIKYEKQLEHAKEYESLNLEKPKPVKKVKDPKNTLKKIDSVIQTLDVSIDLLAELETLREPKESVDKPDKYILQLVKDLPMYEELDSLTWVKSKKINIVNTENLDDNLNILEYKLKHLRTKLGKLNTAQAEYTSKLKDRSRLKHKMSSAKTVQSDCKIFQALMDAYSKTGIKTIVIKNICKRIEDNLNKYSPLVSPEKFTYNFNISHNEFDINVTRHYSDKNVTSDVRCLSGAEGKSFNLLMLLAILPLTPSSKRTNILILDEMTSGMDADTRNSLYEQYLPAIQKIVPHVIIVDIHNDSIPESREFIATKLGSETKLIKVGE